MFITKKNAEKKLNAAVENALIKGRRAQASDIVKWHTKHAKNDKALEESFSQQSIKNFCINIWDEFKESDGTYGYVEMQEVPDRVCFDLLNHVLGFAKNNEAIKSTGAILGIRYCDSSTTSPNMIGSEYEFILFKRWELTIKKASYDSILLIINELKSVPPFNQTPINLISES